MTSGLETGERDRAKKQVAHTRRSKHKQMLAAIENTFIVDQL